MQTAHRTTLEAFSWRARALAGRRRACVGETVLWRASRGASSAQVVQEVLLECGSIDAAIKRLTDLKLSSDDATVAAAVAVAGGERACALFGAGSAVQQRSVHLLVALAAARFGALGWAWRGAAPRASPLRIASCATARSERRHAGRAPGAPAAAALPRAHAGRRRHAAPLAAARRRRRRRAPRRRAASNRVRGSSGSGAAAATRAQRGGGGGRGAPGSGAAGPSDGRAVGGLLGGGDARLQGHGRRQGAGGDGAAAL